jgi:predicted RNA-binding protein with PIN domain
MKYYLIDGNNLIGKIKRIQSIQVKDKQSSREMLVTLLESYFQNKKDGVTLFFDGHESNKIGSSLIKIKYSNNRTADEEIREVITNYKNKRNLIVVSSDRGITDYAHVCSSNVITSEQFVTLINTKQFEEPEHKKIVQLEKDKDEFLKLFGIK